jgi:hypothetical protein
MKLGLAHRAWLGTLLLILFIRHAEQPERANFEARKSPCFEIAKRDEVAIVL